MGPMSFDLGCLLGVLLLAYVVLGHQSGYSDSGLAGVLGGGSQPQDVEQNGWGGGAHGHECEQPASPEGGTMAQEDQREAVSRQAQREWLLHTVSEMWGLINQGFEQHRAAAAQRAMPAGGAESESGNGHNTVGVMQGHAVNDCSAPSPASTSVWADSLGFAAFCMIRLTIGMHAYPGYEFLVDERVRVKAELQALDVGAELLVLRERVLEGVTISIEDVVSAVSELSL